MKKTVEDYMNLPYTIELQRDAETGWFVRVQELPGCMSQGDTAEEALDMIQDAMAGWLEVALEDGMAIPEPRPEVDYSGKFVVRVPKSLHRDLVLTADREGASLNQYINTELARAVGVRSSPPAVASSAEIEPVSRWPGLQVALKQVLVNAGYREEAAALDEHLFAEWTGGQIAQIQAAIEMGNVFAAHAYAVNAAATVAKTDSENPILAVFSQLFELLGAEIEMIRRLQQRVLDVGPVSARVTSYVSQKNTVLARQFVREEEAAYAVSALLPERPKRGVKPW